MPVCLVGFVEVGFEGSGRLSRRVCTAEAIDVAPDRNEEDGRLRVKIRCRGRGGHVTLTDASRSVRGGGIDWFVHFSVWMNIHWADERGNREDEWCLDVTDGGSWTTGWDGMIRRW